MGGVTHGGHQAEGAEWGPRMDLALPHPSPELGPPLPPREAGAQPGMGSSSSGQLSCHITAPGRPQKVPRGPVEGPHLEAASLSPGSLPGGPTDVWGWVIL